MLELVPVKKRFEENLIKSIPGQIENNTAGILADELRKRDWFLLHAHLLRFFQTPKNAVITQISWEEKSDNPQYEGTSYLLAGLEEVDLIQLVLSEKKQVLIEALGKKTINQPSILSEMEISNPVWLNVWSVSLHETKNLNYGISDLSEKINGIFELLAQGGKPVPENIVELISKCTFADLSSCQYRKQLWNNLPLKFQNTFLEATASVYLEKVVTGTVGDDTLENLLHDRITSDDFMTSYLEKKQKDIGAVLAVYETVMGLKDHFLADYVLYFQGNIDDVQSSRLGNLITKMQFRISAQQVFEKAKHNSGFKVALNKCKGLVHFTFWDKYSITTFLEKKFQSNPFRMR
ncbi:MAG: hypothetical protein WDO19_03860 [Bacteroidota bacterium]